MGATQVSPGQRPPVKRRGWLRRNWWAWAIPLIGIVGLMLVLVYAYIRTTIPEAPVGPQTTVLLDSHGHLITRIHAEVNRTIIPSSQIPDVTKRAVVSIEDKNFYHEGGVSPVAIIRAAWADLTHRGVVQGGSTITQQYVKNVYTGNERTFARKIKEAIIAVKIAHQYSKDEILSKYLNTVYFGNGAYGVQAAAQTYWGIPARRLNLERSAMLAGIISAPSTYDPVRNPEAARERRNVVLRDMAQQGYITQAEAASIESLPVKVRHQSTRTAPHAYFVDYVNRILQGKYGEAATFQGGLRVTTTLDSTDQDAAEQAIANRLRNPSDPSAALVAIDPTTGAIRAMVGGRDFSTAKINLATQAHRQAGSSFKPYTFATAMKQRINPMSLWNGPPQITIPDPRCFTNGKPWQVSNFADESAGTMTLLDATAHSVNTIYAQVVTQVGPDQVAKTAHELGITSHLDPVCSITLGSQLVTPLEMASAYATFASRGIRHTPQAISEVRNAGGSVLDRPSTRGVRAIGENDADLTTYALEGVVQRGTGTAANIGRPVAGKTGTAQNYVDAWFCGYTPQLATCVWVGYPQGEKTMTNVEGFPTVFGGSLPALIWHDFMTAAMAKLPVQSFATPSFAGYNGQPHGTVSPSPSPSPSPSASPSPSVTHTTPPPTTPPPTTPPPSPSPSPSPSASAPSAAPPGKP